jgi:hypothetical protein
LARNTPEVFDEMSLRSEMVVMLPCRRPRSPYRSVKGIAKHDLYRAELQCQVAKYEHLYRLNPTAADHAMTSGPGQPGTPSQTRAKSPRSPLLPLAFVGWFMNALVSGHDRVTREGGGTRLDASSRWVELLASHHTGEAERTGVPKSDAAGKMNERKVFDEMPPPPERVAGPEPFGWDSWEPCRRHKANTGNAGFFTPCFALQQSRRRTDGIGNILMLSANQILVRILP